MFDYGDLKAFCRRHFDTAYPWEANFDHASREEQMILALLWQAMVREAPNGLIPDEMPDKVKKVIING